MTITLPNADALPHANALNVAKDFSTLTGLEQLLATFAGKTGYNGMVQTMGFEPVGAVEGEVTFEGTPTRAHFNPLGNVHGGYAATLLDTVMGCAVHSSLKAGEGFTTLELKIAYHRPMSEASGPLRATGKIISRGKRTGFAEGHVYDNQGRLCASGTTTCLIFPIA